MAKPGFKPSLSSCKVQSLKYTVAQAGLVYENHIRIIWNKLLSQMKNGNIKSLVGSNEGISDQCESSYITLSKKM